jgi:hypothetical protein
MPALTKTRHLRKGYIQVDYHLLFPHLVDKYLWLNVDALIVQKFRYQEQENEARADESDCVSYTFERIST